MTGEAVFDDTRQYRYRLSRQWLLGDGVCVFIMLNPSTADEHVLDPTIRRCVAFAKRWGYNRLEVLNLFAWRSTDPKVLPSIGDPIGPDNQRWIEDIATRATTARVVCAWGRHGGLKMRGLEVQARLRAIGVPLFCLGLNSDGTPCHPLYLADETALVSF